MSEQEDPEEERFFIAEVRRHGKHWHWRYDVPGVGVHYGVTIEPRQAWDFLCEAKRAMAEEVAPPSLSDLLGDATK